MSSVPSGLPSHLRHTILLSWLCCAPLLCQSSHIAFHGGIVNTGRPVRPVVRWGFGRLASFLQCIAETRLLPIRVGCLHRSCSWQPADRPRDGGLPCAVFVDGPGVEAREVLSIPSVCSPPFRKLVKQSMKGTLNHSTARGGKGDTETPPTGFSDDHGDRFLLLVDRNQAAVSPQYCAPVNLEDATLDSQATEFIVDSLHFSRWRVFKSRRPSRKKGVDGDEVEEGSEI